MKDRQIHHNMLSLLPEVRNLMEVKYSCKTNQPNMTKAAWTCVSFFYASVIHVDIPQVIEEFTCELVVWNFKHIFP